MHLSESQVHIEVFENHTVSLTCQNWLQVHCVWAAAEAYSAPSIVLTSRTEDGVHVFDDFREAYGWLNHNTDENDKVPFITLMS